MIVPRSLLSFPALPAPRRAVRWLLPALFLLAGWQPAGADEPRVSFPEAANIRPGRPFVGPMPSALSSYTHPDDLVVFDSSAATITVVNGGFSGTFGATTVVASSSVGTSTGNTIPFGTAAAVHQGCVSPAQQLYYWDNSLLAFVVIDLTDSTYPRKLVPVSANKAFVPGSAYLTTGPTVVWDYSTNTILYLDNGASSAKSTILRGIYRLDPATGNNTLYAPYTAGTVQSLAVKQDGSAVYVFNEHSTNSDYINATVSLIAPTSGTLTVVDGGPAAYGTSLANPRYVEPGSIAWDITNQKINLYDVGDDQTGARILRIDPVAKTRTFIANGSAGPSASSAGSLISSPGSGFVNSAGRNLLVDEDASITYVFPAILAAGSPPTESRIGASQFTNSATVCSYVPPTLPTVSTPTVVLGGNGTTATLGATVGSAGTAITPPVIQSRGVVYSQTSTNANPTVGGTGVTNLASMNMTGTLTVSASALTPGTLYSYAGYVSTFYGTVYTTVGTFTTAAAPSVTTAAATSVAGTTATLNGSVTSDGGSTLTARGFVYSTSNTTPTLGGTATTTLTDASATTGSFGDSASPLNINTTYYFRAYATNGVGTIYGGVLTFKTLIPPTANVQTVSVAFNTAKGITLTGSDPQGQALTYAVATAPTHGTFSGTAPNLTYTPTANYQGADSFTFTVTDTSGLMSPAATVSITVAAGTPTATAQAVNVNLNLPRTITLAGTDPDSPALALTYAVATQPTNGTLSGTAPNLTYTPNANYTGGDSFTFSVSNGQNTSAAATVSLTVIGQPTISSFTPASGPVGTTVTITGTNLQNAVGVNFFRNTAGANFTVISSTQVTVKVPTGAGTGILTLLSGSGSNNSSTKFVVTP